MRHVTIALTTYLGPMTSSRGWRWSLFFAGGFLVFAGIALFGPSGTVTGLQDGLFLPGLPFIAVILSEIPLRDGIRHRTLLYPLLGPVPRRTLALVRTAATALLLAAGAGALVFLLAFFPGARTDTVFRDLLAALLGAAAYIGLFGLAQIVWRRGGIVCLAFLILFDIPLGLVPLAIRNLSPSHHLQVVMGRDVWETLPIPLSPPPSSVPVSILILLGVAVVSSLLTAHVFTRRNLGEIC